MGRLVVAFVFLVAASLGGGPRLARSQVGTEQTTPIRATSRQLAAKRYVAAGDRAYVIGTADGRFPPIGWHIPGEMGGVWAHPIKLLDGYWFGLDGRWLPRARSFTTGSGFVRFRYPERDGVRLTRTEFAPDGIPIILVRLDLHNAGAADRSLNLKMDVRSDLMAAYPWGETRPSNRKLDRRDSASAEEEGLMFTDGGEDWRAAVAAQPAPVTARIKRDAWGSSSAEEVKTHNDYGKGAGGQIRWDITVPGSGDATVWVAVGGSTSNDVDLGGLLQDALGHATELFKTKLNARQDLLAKSVVDVPERTLENAVTWGKLNLADLTRTVTDVAVRDVDEGESYPDPITTFDSLTGIGAGYPDYPWYFGTDGAYTAYPLVAAGQWETLMSHLRAIRDVSVAVNGDTGKVVHEVVSDGSVYFGANDDPGNTNETGQFAVAVELLWRWTGDEEFLDEMYEFVVRGLEYVVSTLDKDGDGWPEGNGMVERDGMGSETLDVTAYTWQALRALERMAIARGDGDRAAWADGHADAIEKRFEKAWWLPAEKAYADSLCNRADVVAPKKRRANGWVNVCRHKNERLQQRHWIVATPLEVGLASADRSVKALDSIESRTFTGHYGLWHTGRGGGPDGAGELRVWTLPNSVAAVAEANLGRVGKSHALRYMTSISKLLNLEMPGALPEIAPSPQYDPFAPFIERAMFMQAWSSYGVIWPVVHHLAGIRPNVPAGRLVVVPQIPSSWPGLSVENLAVGDGSVGVSATRAEDRLETIVSGPPNLVLTIGQVLPRLASVTEVTLDGAPTTYEVVDTFRGREVRVETDLNTSRTLTIGLEDPE